MKALITGANGLIGANLARELQPRVSILRALVRRSSQLDALNGVEIECIVGDVLEKPEYLVPAMQGCEVVFHTAARFAYSGISSAELTRTAVVGTENVIRAAALAGVRRVVVTSSSIVFGSSAEPVVRDESDTIGAINEIDGYKESDYAVSKVLQDEAASALGKRLSIEVVFACPTMSVGAHGTTLGPSNGIIVSYLSDPWRMTFPGGCNIASAQDVALGHWLAATRGKPYEHYLLGGENLTWEQIHKIVAEQCGVAPPRLRINHTLAFCAASIEEVRAKLTKRSPLTTLHQARMLGRYYWYAHAKAASLGYAPRSARSALAQACAWLSGSPHVSRELRATMLLGPEVYAARKLSH